MARGEFAARGVQRQGGGQRECDRRVDGVGRRLVLVRPVQAVFDARRDQEVELRTPVVHALCLVYGARPFAQPLHLGDVAAAVRQLAGHQHRVGGRDRHTLLFEAGEARRQQAVGPFWIVASHGGHPEGPLAERQVRELPLPLSDRRCLGVHPLRPVEIATARGYLRVIGEELRQRAGLAEGQQGVCGTGEVVLRRVEPTGRGTNLAEASQQMRHGRHRRRHRGQYCQAQLLGLAPLAPRHQQLNPGVAQLGVAEAIAVHECGQLARRLVKAHLRVVQAPCRTQPSGLVDQRLQ